MNNIQELQHELETWAKNTKFGDIYDLDCNIKGHISLVLSGGDCLVYMQGARKLSPISLTKLQQLDASVISTIRHYLNS